MAAASEDEDFHSLHTKMMEAFAPLAYLAPDSDPYTNLFYYVDQLMDRVLALLPTTMPSPGGALDHEIDVADIQRRVQLAEESGYSSPPTIAIPDAETAGGGGEVTAVKKPRKPWSDAARAAAAQRMRDRHASKVTSA